MAESKRRPGRPYGANYSSSIRVCFPPEVERALRRARRLTGVTISEMVRKGVMTALASTVGIAVDRIESKRASARTKLKMMDYLRSLARAEISLTDAELAERLRRVDREARRARAKRSAITGHFGRLSQRQTAPPVGRDSEPGASSHSTVA